jgi:hypothetical protein
MGKTITSETELRQVMEEIIEQVIDDVSWELSDMLEEYIRLFVYGFEYFPNAVYYKGSGQPTFQFLRAWKWGQIRKAVSRYEKEIYYDPSNMQYDPKAWLHGSFAGDSRSNLADILNISGYTSSLSLNGKRPLSKLRMPYWSLFVEALFQRDKLNKLFDKNFRRFGVTRK